MEGTKSYLEGRRSLNISLGIRWRTHHLRRACIRDSCLDSVARELRRRVLCIAFQETMVQGYETQTDVRAVLKVPRAAQKSSSSEQVVQRSEKTKAKNGMCSPRLGVECATPSSSIKRRIHVVTTRPWRLIPRRTRAVALRPRPSLLPPPPPRTAMSTAHRPTWDPAQAKDVKGGSRQFSVRDMAAHTKLKFRYGASNLCKQLEYEY